MLKYMRSFIYACNIYGFIADFLSPHQSSERVSLGFDVLLILACICHLGFGK